MSVTDNREVAKVPRNKEDARQRLQQAALELYHERGYDQTTTAEIAARAGVTERTFFRHFPDKREVLFDGEAPLRAALTGAIAEAPAGLGPLGMMLYASHAVVKMLENNRPFSEPRQRVINASPALQERELAKVASLTAALATSLRERGVADRVAPLAAQIGMATIAHAVNSWLEDGSVGLGAQLERAFEELHKLALGDF